MKDVLYWLMQVVWTLLAAWAFVVALVELKMGEAYAHARNPTAAIWHAVGFFLCASATFWLWPW